VTTRRPGAAAGRRGERPSASAARPSSVGLPADRGTAPLAGPFEACWARADCLDAGAPHLVGDEARWGVATAGGLPIGIPGARRSTTGYLASRRVCRRPTRPDSGRGRAAPHGVHPAPAGRSSRGRAGPVASRCCGAHLVLDDAVTVGVATPVQRGEIQLDDGGRSPGVARRPAGAAGHSRWLSCPSVTRVARRRTARRGARCRGGAAQAMPWRRVSRRPIGRRAEAISTPSSWSRCARCSSPRVGRRRDRRPCGSWRGAADDRAR
jgi:hypothetical protein